MRNQYSVEYYSTVSNAPPPPCTHRFRVAAFRRSRSTPIVMCVGPGNQVEAALISCDHPLFIQHPPNTKYNEMTCYMHLLFPTNCMRFAQGTSRFLHTVPTKRCSAALSTKSTMVIVDTYSASSTFLACFLPLAMDAHVPDTFSRVMNGHPAPNTPVPYACWCALNFGMKHPFFFTRLQAQFRDMIFDSYMRQEQYRRFILN